MSTERFLIRTKGGPCDGETRIANSGGVPQWEWPLPDVLGYDAAGGYVKVMESDLPPQDAESRVVRGATYEWREAADGD